VSGTDTLLPLRIPELGPYLGRIVSGTGRTPGGLHLDGIRLRLATRIFESAGEARRLASREKRTAAVQAIGRDAWLVAWEEAVGSTVGLLMERVSAQLDAEARAVGLPKRRRRRMLPGNDEARAARARLGSSGTGLVQVLNQLEHVSGQAVAATGLDSGAMAAWQRALRLAGRRLEAAWLALEDEVTREAARWQQEANLVAAWRRPVLGVIVAGAAGTALAVWLGLIFGGYLAPPWWLAALWSEMTP
jgi:hypothetical protein